MVLVEVDSIEAKQASLAGLAKMRWRAVTLPLRGPSNVVAAFLSEKRTVETIPARTRLIR